MQQMFIILYKYKAQGEKKLGPVRQFRIYADDLEERCEDTACRAQESLETQWVDHLDELSEKITLQRKTNNKSAATLPRKA